MRGRRNALRQQSEERIALAWDIEFFARQKRLLPLKHYIAQPPKTIRYQPGSEVLEVVRALQEKGIPMKIRKVKRAPSAGAAGAAKGKGEGEG